MYCVYAGICLIALGFCIYRKMKIGKESSSDEGHSLRDNAPLGRNVNIEDLNLPQEEENERRPLPPIPLSKRPLPDIPLGAQLKRLSRQLDELNRKNQTLRRSPPPPPSTYYDTGMYPPTYPPTYAYMPPHPYY
jgi:hypothetical protein